MTQADATLPTVARLPVFAGERHGDRLQDSPASPSRGAP